jgi:hypothetical protein
MPALPSRRSRLCAERYPSSLRLFPESGHVLPEIGYPDSLKVALASGGLSGGEGSQGLRAVTGTGCNRAQPHVNTKLTHYQTLMR